MNTKKRVRMSTAISLVLIPVLLAACDTGQPPDQQRDVYRKFEDCMADWGKTELCQQLGQADAAQFATETTGSTQSSSGGSTFIYWGPSYFPDNRSVAYGGQSYQPKTNRAMSRPFMVRSTSSVAARTSPATAGRSSVARGGFGASGARAGSSGG